MECMSDYIASCVLVQDYYTKYGYNYFPMRDEQQDWIQTSFKEENGSTTLEYERKRNTSDIMDNAIKVLCNNLCRISVLEGLCEREVYVPISLRFFKLLRIH